MPAIVPAAGAGRRMGGRKLLLPVGGEPMVEATVGALRAGGAGRVVLVVDPDDEALQAWARGAGVELAVNPDPGRPMLASVWEGLAALGGPEAVAAAGEDLLVCPADLPRLRPETVRRLAEGRRRSGALLARPVYRGGHGHPLVVAPELVAEIPRLDLGIGLRQLLLLHPERTLELAVDDPGVVLDVDTPEDYAALEGDPPEP